MKPPRAAALAFLVVSTCGITCGRGARFGGHLRAEGQCAGQDMGSERVSVLVVLGRVEGGDLDVETGPLCGVLRGKWAGPESATFARQPCRSAGGPWSGARAYASAWGGGEAWGSSPTLESGSATRVDDGLLVELHLADLAAVGGRVACSAELSGTLAPQ